MNKKRRNESTQCFSFPSSFLKTLCFSTYLFLSIILILENLKGDYFMELITYEQLVEYLGEIITKDIIHMGIRQGFILYCVLGIVFSLFHLLYETAQEKHYKRKGTYSGNLTERECYLLDEKFKKCSENFTDENLKQLGALAFVFIESERKNKEDIKKFWDKFKFWKRG